MKRIKNNKKKLIHFTEWHISLFRHRNFTNIRSKQKPKHTYAHTHTNTHTHTQFNRLW